tara:strand:- start:8870 stop:10846 length:1977 start_codon:yes stop_codon:yes gene_type:complete
MVDSYTFDREPKEQADRAAYWNDQIKKARRFEETWRDRCHDIVERYRDDNPERLMRETRMNIFYSNVDTLKSALYFKTPKPRVKRRFKDSDPVARTVATVIERGLQFQLDDYDFDVNVRRAIEDMLIVGRGVLRMVYEPLLVEGEPERIPVTVNAVTGMGEVAPGQLGDVQVGQSFVDPDGNPVDMAMVKQDAQGAYMDGDPVEFIGEQSVRCEYVYWEDFTMSPARCWDDVSWISFRHLMTRQELVDYYKQKGEAIPLTYRGEMSGYDDDGQPDMAEIFEIWDRRTGKQIFIAGDYNEILEEFDDPYNLDDFWPMPEPLYAISTTDTTRPVPEILTYEDQLFELDLITQRIANLTEALKRRGVYDASFQELVRLSDAGDNTFIPVDNMAMLQAGGGLANVMQEAPLDGIIKALAQLYQSRQIAIQTIYEITGISDIMRGQSASRETATAQRIKGQFGAMRLVNRQRRIEQFLDRIMELKAELMVENLEPRLLSRITGINITPEAVALMRDERLRNYKVSVDTDESSAIDSASEQKSRTDFLIGMTQFLQAIGPIVQSGAVGFEQAKQMLLFAARSFPGSRDLEETLEAIEPPQAQPNPADKLVEVEAAKVQAQADQAAADAQVKVARLQLDQQRAATDAQFKQQKLDIDAAKVVTTG